MIEKIHERCEKNSTFRKVRLLSIAALISLTAILPLLLIHMSEYLKTDLTANSQLTYFLIYFSFILLSIPAFYGLFNVKRNPVWIIFFLIPIGAVLEFFFDVLAPFFIPFLMEIGIYWLISNEYRRQEREKAASVDPHS